MVAQAAELQVVLITWQEKESVLQAKEITVEMVTLMEQAAAADAQNQVILMVRVKAEMESLIVFLDYLRYMVEVEVQGCIPVLEGPVVLAAAVKAILFH